VNNTAENDLEFPKVKWLKYTGKVGKCIAIDVKDLTHQKSLNSINF